MSFERVYMVWDIYDGVRSGVADFQGAPHYFADEFSDGADGYLDLFTLYPVTAEFLQCADRYWAIFRNWESKFHRGLAELRTHPGHGGIDAEYDDLKSWLDEQVALLEALPTRCTSTFRALSGQDDLPPGILREIEVEWSAAPG